MTAARRCRLPSLAMDDTIRELITRLHESSPPFVLALTGGGAAAAGWLLAVPGGSRTVLEVIVPYAEQAVCEFLGNRPESFCSVATARAMAAGAWQRAGWLAPGATVAGVGCTASLRSDRPKRGDHRFHLAVHTADRRRTWSLTLAKEQRDRAAEETVLDIVLLNALAESFGIAERLMVPLLPGEEIHTEMEAAADLLAELLAGRAAVVCREPDGRFHTDGPRPGLLLSGSFNPLHEGHCTLVALAGRLHGLPAAFELTVVNADKPPLEPGEVRRRLEQFTWRAPVWLTRAPMFADKAALFPGAVFLVGADTAERIVQPRFYHGSEEQMAEALGSFRAHGCRFLVAGRVDCSGVFRSADDLCIPPACRDLFTGLPASAFRLDVSSTQLRKELS
jgi:nicotinamide mononucleotide (NMN) deamidase PncC